MVNWTTLRPQPQNFSMKKTLFYFFLKNVLWKNFFYFLTKNFYYILRNGTS